MPRRVVVRKTGARKGFGSILAHSLLQGSGSNADLSIGSGSLSAHGYLNGVGYTQRRGFGSILAHGQLVAQGKTIRSGSGPVRAHSVVAGAGRTVRSGFGEVVASSILEGTGLMPGAPPQSYGPRHVKFLVDNRFTTQGLSPANETELRSRLSWLVFDWNTLLAKTTDLQLLFDGSNDVEFVDISEIPTIFYQGSEVVPEDWHFYFTIELGTGLTTAASSTNVGAGRVTTKGWGALGFAFVAIWSESERVSNEMLPSGLSTKTQDYVQQMYYITHEGLHNLGVGVGEYYAVNIIADITGTTPDLSTLVTPGDTSWPFFEGIYHDSRQNVQLDPMMKTNADWDIITWLENMQYSELTSRNVNEVITFRNHFLQHLAVLDYNAPLLLYAEVVTVEVRNALDSTPIVGAAVEMYMTNQSIYNHQRLDQAPEIQITDSNGRVQFTWGGVQGQGFSSNNLFRGFKVEAVGFQRGGAGLSAWDLNAYYNLGGGSVGEWHHNGIVSIALQPAVPDPPVQWWQRRLKVYADSAFTTGLSAGTQQELATRIAELYVPHWNQILAKNTPLELVFDPANDLQLLHYSQVSNPPNFQTDFPPHAADRSTHTYGIWIYKIFNERSVGATTYRTGVDQMSSVSNGWPAIWSQDDVNTNTSIPSTIYGATQDYIDQSMTTLHEWGHGHGAGLTEYYGKYGQWDNSGIAPNLSYNSGTAQNAPYQIARSLVWDDPLAQVLEYSSVQDYLDRVAYCPLTASLIEAYIQNTIPSNDYYYNHGSQTLRIPGPTTAVTVIVEVLNAVDDTPIQGASVSMYGLDSLNIMSSTTVPVSTLLTNASGQCTFTWGTDSAAGLDTQQEHSRMFKVQASGFPNGGDWLCGFDMQARKLEQLGYHTQVVNDWHYFGKLTIKL